MSRVALVACVAGLLAVAQSGPAFAAGGTRSTNLCTLDAARAFPKRHRNSRSGSAFIKDIERVSGTDRDRAVTEQVLSGNIPEFLRALVPVNLRGTSPGQADIDVTICVTPDYMAVGDDADFVRVPLGLPAAARIADELDLFLPTTKMVDAIYAQAAVRLPPIPMPPTAQMESTDYFWRHNQAVNNQRPGKRLADLTAGQKKDIVLSNRLRAKPGRVAIYGWHRPNGKPIQPLSTVHHAGYADYSHGLRLVSPVALVNGQPRRLEEILQDPALSSIVSSEGAIPAPRSLLRALR